MPRKFLFTLTFLLLAVGLYGQTDTGELRITVTDETQHPLQATVQLVSEANAYRRTF